ncbi:hypothetical protein K2D_46740 (plasmid) [Planctomycetes bacterium K2D]|nr:hypothetical protein K2D_46740 [Planctomycetes bacterium K2D]
MQRGLQEEFHIVTLDGSHHVIRTHQITIGLVNQTQVHPREAFRPAILDAAVAVLLVHNHPSGDPTPSPNDIKLTRFLMDAGKQLGISVLDHIIIAKHGTTSLTEAVPRELGL